METKKTPAKKKTPKATQKCGNVKPEPQEPKTPKPKKKKELKTINWKPFPKG